MAKTGTKQRDFTVNAVIQVMVGIGIKATSFEDALEQAKELKVQDFVDVKGEYVDGRAPALAWITDQSADFINQ